jgi:hypothetical protein
MWATITMTSRERQRAHVLTRLLVGEVATAEAALLLGLSERQVWRLRAGYERDGPAALVHGNRGRASPRRRDPALAERILTVARTTYDGANDCHLAELLAERESSRDRPVLAAPPAPGGRPGGTRGVAVRSDALGVVSAEGTRRPAARRLAQGMAGLWSGILATPRNGRSERYLAFARYVPLPKQNVAGSNPVSRSTSLS